MSSDATLPFGPIQMLVISSERTTFTGEVLPELRRLSDEGLVRLVDLLFVAKRGGEIESVQATELSTEEAEEFGALVGALIGIGFAGEDGALASAPPPEQQSSRMATSSTRTKSGTSPTPSPRTAGPPSP